MTFITYAQNFEDVMLWRALGHISGGFYVDVGAQHPTNESVTKAFYDAGWTGINIEPASQWFDLLVQERHRDVNLQIAVGSAAQEQPFFNIPDTGLSTLDPELAKRHALEQGYPTELSAVDVCPLDSVLAEHAPGEVHFLKIDVEGSEQQVLQSIDFSRVKPWVLVVEATEPNTQVDCSHEWEHLIPSDLYDSVYFDGLNRFYLSREHPELAPAFTAPPNYWDGFVKHDLLQALSTAGQLRERIEELEPVETQNNDLVLQNQKLRVQQHKLERQLTSLKRDFQDLRTELSSTAERATNAERDAQTRQEKIDQLHETSHTWFLRANDFEQRLESIRQSKTWRLTQPVRAALDGGIQAAGASRGFMNAGLARTINRFQQPLSEMMRVVLARPRIAQGINQLLQRFPALQIQLLEIALRHGVIAPAGAAPESGQTPGARPDTPSGLSPSIRAIFEDLTPTSPQNAAAENEGVH